MSPTVVFVLLVLVWLLFCWLICQASARKERRLMRERLGREVKNPQMVKHPERPTDLPEFCPICSRPMSLPIATAVIVTPTGRESVIVCSHCLALGALDSAISAEQAAHQN